MTDHIFAVGDRVRITRAVSDGEEFGGSYEVSACLPSEGSEPRYRVKSIAESFSRVATESSMQALFGPNRQVPTIASKASIRAHNEPAQVSLAATSATRLSLGVH